MRIAEIEVRPLVSNVELRRRSEWGQAVTAEWDATKEVVEVAAQLVAGIAEVSMLRTALERLMAATRHKEDVSRRRS